jgi:acetyl esterase/lipase
MKYNPILILLIFMITTSLAQKTIPLYPGKIPNGKDVADKEVTEESDGITIVSKISKPTITSYIPQKEKFNGTAVIIFPGGGYRVNAISHEGHDVAKKLNEFGVAAFVVKYRVPDDETMIDRETGPLQDAQQAIRYVREHAAELGIRQIGIMGFSAGGHLASTAGTHFQKPVLSNASNVNLRPDFMILVYPVISFQNDIAHLGSREQLIGKTPSKEKIEYYSNEMQVTADTPPTFLVHAADDDAVKVENSIRLYESLLKYKVPAELHIYQKGGHGFGMINKTTSDRWMERCQNWLASNGWLKKL